MACRLACACGWQEGTAQELQVEQAVPKNHVHTARTSTAGIRSTKPHLGCAAPRDDTNEQADGALWTLRCKTSLAAAAAAQLLLQGWAATAAAAIVTPTRCWQRVCGEAQHAARLDMRKAKAAQWASEAEEAHRYIALMHRNRPALTHWGGTGAGRQSVSRSGRRAGTPHCLQTGQ